MTIDRRTFLAAGMVFAGASLLPRLAIGTQARTRLILLGTAGGPRPRNTRSAPAQLIVAGDSAYVVDCGDGVARQMALAGVPLASLRGVFITHQHSDHVADFGNLLLIAWVSGLKTRVDSFGPPPLREMTQQFLMLNAVDIRTRIADEERIPIAPLLHTHDLSAAGPVFEDGNVRVSAALVHHPPMTPAFGYRFDTADRSIVISGDTTPSESLIRLAKGADVLVHEALFPSAVDRLVAGVKNAPRLKESILSHHTSAEEAGRVAQAAGVRTLVLSHLIPAEDPLVTEASWIEAARTHFAGRIVVGSDLMEIAAD